MNPQEIEEIVVLDNENVKDETSINLVSNDANNKNMNSNVVEDNIDKQNKRFSENIGLFTLKTGTNWLEYAKSLPIPKMLFSEFWHEGEVCILFADTNVGKSILAVQIANSISKGEPIEGFKLEATSQKVLYFDFELNEKQFETRYSNNYENHYDFNNNFYRIVINPETEIPDNQPIEDYLSNSIESVIKETEIKVLIIDNITYLKSETEKAKDALPLMKHLKSWKSKYGLSILVLAHTPKIDLYKPISHNDIQGSKMVSNFCDSSFAIGKSQLDQNLRYIKQIKERSSDKLYGEDNICLCELNKPDNFLQFEFIKYDSESKHLKLQDDNDKKSFSIEIEKLQAEGLSLREIGAKLGCSHMKVKRMLEKKEM